MKLRSILSLTLFSVILLAGCGKDDDDNGNQQPQAEANLTASKWKVNGATAGGINLNGLIDACYFDNTITFTSDKKGKTEEGADVCDPTTAGNFTWSFNSTETELTLSAKLLPIGSNVFKVVTLNATTLVLSQVISLPPAQIPAEVLVTFSH